MGVLHVFNPENDLALASGQKNYTAPPLARKIRDDLQMLPLWLAKEADLIYAKKTELNNTFLNHIKTQIPLFQNVELWQNGAVIDGIEPWGWSLSIYEELARMGIDCSSMPLEQLNYIRQKTHRRTSLQILQWLNKNYPRFCPEEMPVLCETETEVETAMRNFGDCMLKAPWSGSGRGVQHARYAVIGYYRDWFRGVLKRQGGIMCEPFLTNIHDFAMEFYSNGREVEFLGYSVFFSNAQFSYDKALVASQDYLFSYLSRFVPEEQLKELTVVMVQCLNTIYAQFYHGYIGVDMMLYETKAGAVRIMPCIEVNLRKTMGMIACRIGEDFIQKGTVGEMSVLYHHCEERAMEYSQQLIPPQISNGRLEKGQLSLVPISANSLYTAVVSIP